MGQDVGRNISPCIGHANDDVLTRDPRLVTPTGFSSIVGAPLR